VGERSKEEARIYSAGPKHYLAASPQNVLYGRFADAIGRPEKRLFPGLIALALAVVAVWRPFTRTRAAYVVGLAIAMDLSFGPNGLTYGWLREYVFPYRGLRAPARAGGVWLVLIAVLAGLGWARLQQGGRWATRITRWPLAAVVFVALALEYVVSPRPLITAPITPAPVYEWLAARRDDGAVIELPLPDEHALPGHDAEFMYQSAFHWRPIVNGYSGNVPESYVEVLREMRNFPSNSAIGLLRRIGVRYVVVHERFYGSIRYRQVIEALDERTDVMKQALLGHVGDEVTVYSPTNAVHD
jgi:hypothetical protein